MNDVVRIAEIVPRGILLEGSFKSPERFVPAIIPVTDGKNIPNNIKNDVYSEPSTSVSSSPS